MNITIRRFTEADAPAVSALIRRTLRVSNARDYSPREIEALVQRHTPEYIVGRAGWTHFYVACAEGGDIVGCGAIGPYWDSAEESCLFSIFVDPDWQRRGAGRRIMEALEADEFFLRAKRVEIPASITACDFYRRLGYDYRDGVDAPDAEGLFRLEKRREPQTGGQHALI